MWVEDNYFRTFAMASHRRCHKLANSKEAKKVAQNFEAFQLFASTVNLIIENYLVVFCEAVVSL